MSGSTPNFLRSYHERTEAAAGRVRLRRTRDNPKRCCCSRETFVRSLGGHDERLPFSRVILPAPCGTRPAVPHDSARGHVMTRQGARQNMPGPRVPRGPSDPGAPTGPSLLWTASRHHRPGLRHLSGRLVRCRYPALGTSPTAQSSFQDRYRARPSL